MTKYDLEYEKKKFYAARHIRDKRHRYTEASKGKVSLLEWWETMFKDDYNAYAKRMGVFEVDGSISFGEAMRRSRIREKKRKLKRENDQSV